MNGLANILPDKAILKPSLALFTVTFLLQFIALIYSAFQIDPPPSYALLEPIAFLWVVCWWFEAEMRRSKTHWPLDAGMLLYATWFLFLPIYLIKTRGVSGIIGIAGFVASMIAGWIAATVLILLIW